MSLSRRNFLTASATAASLLLPSRSMAFSRDLQNSVSLTVQQMRDEGRISDNERTAWSVYDFNRGETLVSINENNALQAASMVKIFVALAYFYLHKNTPYQYPYGNIEQQAMERMLVRSSNSATNAIMEWCGGPRRVQQLCQEATGHQFPNLYVVEYIPKGGRTYTNRASAYDYRRFYELLWRNMLPNAYELKRVLSIRNRDRIKVEAMPYDTTIYNKTGSTGMLCGDCGIIQLGYDNFSYSFVAIIERDRKAGNYGAWIRGRGRAMREISEVVFYHMQERYASRGYTPSYEPNNHIEYQNNSSFDQLNQDFSTPKRYSTGTAQISWD